jgi:hypothetical protein
VGARLPARASREDGQAEGEEEVVEDIDIPRGGPSLDLALPRHVRDVDDAAVGERDRFQEAREVPHLARPALQLDLLLQVEAHVGRQRVGRVGGGDHERQEADPQSVLEPELRELGRHEGMQRAIRRPAREQVDATPPQLAGTGPGEDEGLLPAGLDELVNDVQQLRDTLNLVDDHDAAIRFAEHPLAKTLGASAQLPVQLRPEKVEEERFRDDLAEPGRFPCPPRPEKKKALAR